MCIVVITRMLECGLNKLQHTVGQVKGLASTVVNLILAHHLATIGLEPIVRDHVLLLHFHLQDGICVVEGILCTQKSMLCSDARLITKGGCQRSTGLLHRLSCIKCGLPSILDGTIVRLQFAFLAEFLLTSNHLLVLRGTCHSDHGLHSPLAFTPHL